MRVERLQQLLGVTERDARAFMRGIDTDRDGWVTFQQVNDFLALHTVYPDGYVPTDPVTIYIARAEDGNCLYVGITGARLRRLHSHAKSSAWWPDAVTVELEHQPTRERAEARERQLIRELRPAFNIVYAETG